jgi:Gluconate 2-dehydrogenase subunit 3
MAWTPITRRGALRLAATAALMPYDWCLSSNGSTLRDSRGYGRDPDLTKQHAPWLRPFDANQLATAACLCELILPADPPHPSAKDLGVHHFLDEWVGAPYAEMQGDRQIVLEVFAILDRDAHETAGLAFSQVNLRQQTAALDRCHDDNGRGHSGICRLVDLICAGYYTTREGHAAIGYVGNVAMPQFAGPPSDVVTRLEQLYSQLGVASRGSNAH